MAVFWATTGFQRDNAFDFHIRPAPFQAGLVGDIGDFFQSFIINLQHLQEFVLGQANALFQCFSRAISTMLMPLS